ncbi:olfactory receptor 7G1-like [Perognathus longimembris pacificus]|uniref:olfactory receptor 7G1-like n=1 Tax=Perognathus longimembris pacificus TaxID=214514 RepID=UPI002018BFF7|nr:olfactory receptor 7G1-like [Perognathus longimembris pacificus]
MNITVDSPCCFISNKIGLHHEIHKPTVVSELFLLGFTNDTELQPLIFSLFLSIYLITILGNLLIILAISSDPHLHTTMYFLSNLSFNDICLSTTRAPKMLVNTHTQDQGILYAGFLAQTTLTFCGLESCLLEVMAYDHYVAICHPLRYTNIMHPGLYVLLVLCSLLMSAEHVLLHSLMVLHLSFCRYVEVLYFFCELSQVIKLACSDILVNNNLIYLVGVTVVCVPLSRTIFFYIQIVSSILRISSAGGRSKAFSTCGSRLLVVSLFYGTGFGVYLSSAVIDASIKNMVPSMLYIVVPPLMNPLIYSLRNGEVKAALRTLIIVAPLLWHCPWFDDLRS